MSTNCRLHAWNVPDGLRCPECVFDGGLQQSNHVITGTGPIALDMAIKIINPIAGTEKWLREIARRSGYWTAIKQAREMQSR